MLATVIMIIVFFIFIIIGMPISFALLIAAIIYIIYNGDISLIIVPIRLLRSTNSFTLLSVPFFVLAGNLMNMTGLTKTLVDFADLFVGHLRGGLAHVTIVTSMFFGGCTGNAISDAIAVGKVLIPTMADKGYEKDFTAAVVAAASTMGPIIPPSIAFVLYAGVSNLSIRDLFIAGIIPGILICLFQMVVAAYYSHKRNYPKRTKKITIKEALLITRKAIFAIAGACGGVGAGRAGVFTPTEAAAIGAFYAFLIGVFVYRELTLHKLIKILIESAVESGAVMLIVGAASLFGYAIANEQLPIKFAQMVLDITTNKFYALMMVNSMLLVMGMFMDSAPAIVIITPVLLPLYNALGIDPLQAGIITCVNLVTGLATPPVGCCLFATSVMSHEPFEKVSKAIFPFILANIAVLLLISYVPVVTLFVPRIFGY